MTAYLDRLRQTIDAIQLLAKVFLLSKKLTRAERLKLAAKWAAHIPALALALADVLDLEPAAFAALPFTGQSLRDATEEVRELANLKTITDDLQGQIACRLGQAKADLADQVARGVTEVNGVMHSQLSDRDLVARLKPVVLPMNQIRQDALKKRLSSRDSNRKLKQLGARKVQVVEQDLRLKKAELRVKDGHPLTQADLAPPEE